MGILRSLFGKHPNPAEEIRRFENTIQLHQEQLFGITLYSKGIELMYSDQPELVKMNRKSFQNVKDRIEPSIYAGESLLQQVKADPSKVKHLKQFKFPPISGHPMLDQMTQRAQILVRTYERMFPKRSKSEPLTEDELSSLMIEAANQL